MKRTLVLILFFLNGSLFTQTTRYYKPGQKFSNAGNACLLIRNNPGDLKHLNELNSYSSFKAVKLVGFNQADALLDSVLCAVSRHLQPVTLTLENCDLLILSRFPFVTIEALSLVKNTSFYENNLFSLIKNNPLKILSIQQPNEDLITDSLVLLKSLSTVRLSNTKSFAKTNKTETFQLRINNQLKSISIAYAGDLYKHVPTDTLPITKTSAVADLTRSTRPACVRQPVPGIDINDTSYLFIPQSAAVFYYQSGSKISIDKDAFVAADNSAYTGQVKLFYREFRNPVEIMLSGIPMKNTEDGEEKIFKSGGMYEIYAFDKQGRPLKTKSDTSVKINFALTDTAQDFKFYSLKDNGGWDVTDVPVKQVIAPLRKDTAGQITKAISEYYSYLFSQGRDKADTTSYEDRFLSPDHLYIYRKDNLGKMAKGTDSVYCWQDYYNSKRPCTPHFRVKYVRMTKDKSIVFALVPTVRNDFTDTPRHIWPLMNKKFIYTGSMNKEEFRKTFNRKLQCWDLRLEDSNGSVNMTIKTDKTYISLPAGLIVLSDDGTYAPADKGSVAVHRIVQRALYAEAKKFDKKIRYYPQRYNSLNKGSHQKGLFAYTHSKKYQDADELKMDYDTWAAYANARYFSGNSDFRLNKFQENNSVGKALVKSGMGIKNIDCYLHSGQMEDVYVHYSDTDMDSVASGYNAMLYKNINTSYPISKNYKDNQWLVGHYFKNSPNYIIRFSGNGFIQVTKPEEIKTAKRGDEIALSYKQEFDIKGLNSKDITRLILDN